MTQLSSSWRPLLAAACLSLVAACSSYSSTTPSQTTAASTSTGNSSFMTRQTSAGTVLTTSDGMTLYTYARDVPGRSNCYGECAEYWPPYMANNGAQTSGNMTLIARADGRMQWAADGMPLYTFVQDGRPGDVSGHNVHNDWNVVYHM